VTDGPAPIPDPPTAYEDPQTADAADYIRAWQDETIKAAALTVALAKIARGRANGDPLPGTVVREIARVTLVAAGEGW
jgi:hypothetical protein